MKIAFVVIDMILFIILGTAYYFGLDVRFPSIIGVIIFGIILLTLSMSALLISYFRMKRAFIPVLLIFNILALALISLLYYYGFELQWGINKQALTWGLPLVLTVLVNLAALYYAVTREKWSWGIVSFSVVIMAIIYFHVLISSFGTVLLPDSINKTENTSINEENKILALFLADHYKGKDYYAVIKPETSFPEINFMVDSAKNNSEGLGLYFNTKVKDYDFGSLAKHFSEINETPAVLSLRSSPQDGYYIDYDGKFARIFNEGSMSWVRWHQFYPRANGYTEVSLPAYDPDTGYMLIYVGWQGNWLFGTGNIIAYRYTDGKFVEVGRMSMWVS